MSRARLIAEAALAAIEIGEEIAESGIELPPMHPGPQTVAWESKAKVVVYGGDKGGGKTFLAEAKGMELADRPDAVTLIMRRESAEIMGAGGLWEMATKLYQPVGAIGVQSPKKLWTFPTGAKIYFDGCKDAKDRYKYDGADIWRLCIDQAEKFDEVSVWHLILSVLRTATPGVKCQAYLTVNPVPSEDPIGGWLSKMLKDGGWIDPDTGYANEEMSGVVRYWYRANRGRDGATSDQVCFYDTEEEARAAHPQAKYSPMTMTFVHARLEDNPALMADDSYARAMEGLPWHMYERLRRGNWNISAAGGGLADRSWWRRLAINPEKPYADQPLRDVWRGPTVRAWDIAHTKESPGARDKSSSVRFGRHKESGLGVFMDPMAEFTSPGELEDLVCRTMARDPAGTVIWLPQDPAGGIGHIHYLIPRITAYASKNRLPIPTIACARSKGSKRQRANPLLSELQPRSLNAEGEVERHGNLAIVGDGKNVEEFLTQFHIWKGQDGQRDDQIDAAVYAHAEEDRQAKLGQKGIW
jgi:hypothetical protein